MLRFASDLNRDEFDVRYVAVTFEESASEENAGNVFMINLI